MIVGQNRFAALVIAVAVTLTASAVSAQTTRNYDRQGRLTGWSTQDHDEIRHYDQSGRLLGRTTLHSGEAREYTPGGTLTGKTYFLPDGRVRHYDGNGRLLGENR